MMNICITVKHGQENGYFFSSGPIISNYKNYPNNSYTEIKHVNHFAHYPMIIVWGIILLLLMF